MISIRQAHNENVLLVEAVVYKWSMLIGHGDTREQTIYIAGGHSLLLRNILEYILSRLDADAVWIHEDILEHEQLQLCGEVQLATGESGHEHYLMPWSRHGIIEGHGEGRWMDSVASSGCDEVGGT